MREEAQAVCTCGLVVVSSDELDEALLCIECSWIDAGEICTCETCVSVRELAGAGVADE